MRPPVDQATSLAMFTALSQASRLVVFVEILGAGRAGVAAQGLAEALGMKGSALTLHLRTLEAAGLIQVLIRPRGRQEARVVARIDRWAELCDWMMGPLAQADWGAEAPPAVSAVRRAAGRPA